MTFTGLPLTTVLGILGGVGAAVVVLYLLKLRRRRVEVPFVKLWEQVLAEKQTTRLFSQLKRWLSLLVALAIVAALALALGDPRPDAVTRDGRTLVVLVDASASMQATDGEDARGERGVTRFEAALAKVRALIAELGPADRMLLAQLDATATPVTPLTDEPRVLEDGLEQLAPTDVAANLRAGLRLALDVLRDAPQPEVVVVSDGGFDAGRFAPEAFANALAARDVRLSWVKVGEGDANVALTAFAVRRYPLDKSQNEVLVEIYNPTEADAAIELELLGDERTVDVQRLTVHAGERLRRFFQNVSGVDRTMEARIRRTDGEPDLLPADDRAYARVPERRRARVCVVSDGNLYLQAALLLDEYLDVHESTTTQGLCEGRFDVYVFDSWVPDATPPGAALYLHPRPREGGVAPFEVTGEIPGPYFERQDRRHPLLQFTALRDVNIGRALLVRPEPGDRVVGADARGPLLVAGSRQNQPFVALTFDVRESDLALRIAWPLLLLNAIDLFVQERAGYVSSYATGDTWRVPVPGDLASVTIVDPDGEAREVPVDDGRAVYAGRRAGFYELRLEGGASELFAANLGAGEESLIAPAEALTVGTIEAGAPTRGEVGVRREIWLYLVLFALLVLAVEWWTYHRRLTV
ncbi:MAG: VWA domain-containing protein [Myxococcales bacterium]|nr:VWA domain-containing protein [Myxococcales bacterium]